MITMISILTETGLPIHACLLGLIALGIKVLLSE